MKHKKYLLVIGILTITLSLLAMPIPQAKAQFVISTWSFPDTHGQGLDAISYYENSTGSWLLVGGFGPQLTYYSTDNVINWTAYVSIKIRVYCQINTTITGVSSVAAGKNIIRHNVTVYVAGTTTLVFSQQNFTYHSGSIGGDIIYYGYDCVLNFIPSSGATYLITTIFEVFY